jgi:hypothetical protein
MNWNECRQLEGEVWATIEDYPSAQISSLGRLRRSNGPIRTLHYDGNGYCRVILARINHRHTFYLHRLVALAFVPNPDHLLEVDHRDADPRHNWAGNLLWTTHRDNIRTAITRRGSHWRKGVANTANMTTITRVDLISRERVTYLSIKDAVRELNAMQLAAHGNPLTYRNAAPNICTARREKRMAYGFNWE